MTAPKNKKNRVAIFALIGAGALAASVGGVFATNTITINNGGSIEFGSGLTTTSACQTTLTAGLEQALNGDLDGFEVTKIKISDIDTTLCAGKTIHVSLYGSSAVVCNVDGGASWSYDVAATSTEFAVSSGCDAATVEKIAITTS